MVLIPRRKQKLRFFRKNACKHLTPKGDISNSLQPLCFCPERDLVLGTRAYVCQVCYLYEPLSNFHVSDKFEESKKLAEQKIKDEIELEGLKIEEIERDEEVELTIDEFEEEEEISHRFEKRKAGKGEIEEGEEVESECPFCGEFFDDISSHIQNCEFAPDDVSIEDIISSKVKKKKKKKTSKSTSDEEGEGEGEEGEGKKKCPYCGKEFIRLGRHLNSCKKRPKGAAGKKKMEEGDEEESEEEEIEDEEDEDDDEEEEDEKEEYGFDDS